MIGQNNTIIYTVYIYIYINGETSVAEWRLQSCDALWGTTSLQYEVSLSVSLCCSCTLSNFSIAFWHGDRKWERISQRAARTNIYMYIYKKCVCVRHICTDVNFCYLLFFLIYIYIIYIYNIYIYILYIIYIYMRGVTGVAGRSVTNEDTSRGPV